MNDRIQDVLPVAPGQDGILFQTLARPGSGDYVVQVALRLNGQPDATREAAAWEALVARHDALRTAFVWKGQKAPLRVIGRRARMSRATVDLSGQPETMQTARLAAWLEEDRRTGFDLSRAPLLRVTRFDLGDGQHQMVVTFHHAALDGWSVPVLLRDWAALYAGRALPAARPARDETLTAAQPTDLDFWRGELDGFEDAGRWYLPPVEQSASPPRGEVSDILDTDQTVALNTVLRARGLTLSAAVLATWALVQMRSTARDRAVFGVARSGRTGMAGAETRVGMFLNTLPLVATLDGDPTVAEWLATLQTRLRAQASYEHVPLSQIQAVLRRPNGTTLLESAVVFENYPTDPALLGQIPSLTVASVEVLEQTSLPLTLYAIPGERLRLRLLFDATLTSETAVRGLLGDVMATLRQIATAPETRLSAVPVVSRFQPRPSVRAATASAPVAADTSTLAGLWQAILDLPTAPGPDDNFFDLGGHSLLVITLQERIRTEIGAETEIPDLFRHATLAAQAAHIATLAAGPDAPTLPPVQTPARSRGRDRLQQRRAIRTSQEPASHG